MLKPSVELAIDLVEFIREVEKPLCFTQRELLENAFDIYHCLENDDKYEIEGIIERLELEVEEGCEPEEAKGLLARVKKWTEREENYDF